MINYGKQYRDEQVYDGKIRNKTSPDKGHDYYGSMAAMVFMAAAYSFSLTAPALADSKPNAIAGHSFELPNDQTPTVKTKNEQRSYLRPETPSNVCLVLAMDMSGSVDPQEWRLQTEGLARAFEHPTIQNILNSGKHVAVRELVYGGKATTQGEEWHVLTRAEDAPALSAYFRDMDYIDHTQHQGGTTVIQAMEDSLNMIQGCPLGNAKLVVDIQGDGVDDLYFGSPKDSYSPGQTRLQHDQDMGILHARINDENVEVNGLPIIDPNGVDTGLYDYYQEYVAPYGRVFTAHGFEDFERAIILKLAFELASLEIEQPFYAQAHAQSETWADQATAYAPRRHRSPA